MKRRKEDKKESGEMRRRGWARTKPGTPPGQAFGHQFPLLNLSIGNGAAEIRIDIPLGCQHPGSKLNSLFHNMAPTSIFLPCRHIVVYLLEIFSVLWRADLCSSKICMLKS